MATTTVPKAAGRTQHRTLTAANSADNLQLDHGGYEFIEVENRGSTELWARCDGLTAAFNGEIQSVAFGGNSTGTYTLNLLGATTAAIAAGATPQQVQNALTVIGIPVDTVAVSGTADTLVFTFGAGGVDQSAIVVTPTGFNGGTPVVTEVLKGGSATTGADGTWHVGPGASIMIPASDDPHNQVSCSVISTAQVPYSISGMGGS